MNAAATQNALNNLSYTHLAAGPSDFWLHLTRLGEIQLLLPLALLAAVYLWRRSVPASDCLGQRLARRWLAGLGLAVALTAASKLAFFGWGIGSAVWDFTGISGHAMASAAILPCLAWCAARGRPAFTQRLAVGLAMSLAALIAYSRLKVGAHSPSEVVAGFVLGMVVSVLSLRGALALPAVGLAPPLALPLALVAALTLLPLGAPKSRTHDAVIQLALKLSGRSVPFVRADLQRRPRLEQAPLNAVSTSRSGSRPTPGPTVATAMDPTPR
ncbi:phosphatase PAP2 family protein [Paucibacter sp. AS339]|uniref:phosphatase PAP2 family protein n=1 Tax=Paucibacter hankyongi TaxID=3133434 RepID=UPI00309B581C